MTSLDVIIAFKVLPDKWIDNQTRYIVYGHKDQERLFVANPKIEPMEWIVKDKEWKPLQMKWGGSLL